MEVIISKRELMTGSTALAVAAAVPVAATAGTQKSGAPGKPAVVSANDDGAAMRDLWRRLIEETVRHCEAVDAEDETNARAREEIKALDRPWAHAAVIEPNALAGPNANLFRCYQGRVLNHAEERRIVEYPEAASVEQARQASKAALAPSQAAYDKAVKAIRRKYRGPLNTAVEQEQQWLEIRLRTMHEIADARCDGPVARAVKMAVAFVGFVGFLKDANGEASTGYRMEDAERAALLSIYREAVSAGGYDPVAEWRATKWI